MGDVSWTYGRRTPLRVAKLPRMLGTPQLRRSRILLALATFTTTLAAAIGITQLIGNHPAQAISTTWSNELSAADLGAINCFDQYHCVSVGSVSSSAPTSSATSDAGVYWLAGSFPSD